MGKKPLARIMRVHLIALLAIVLLQGGAAAILCRMLEVFNGMFELPIRVDYVLAGISSIFALCDICFVWIKIVPLWSLRNKAPIKCELESFFLYGYTDDGARRYTLYPIVRSLQDGKLYATFGKDCISRFNTTYGYMNNTPMQIAAYRKDGTQIDVGDEVYMYFNKALKKKVNVDELKTTITVDGKRMSLLHTQEKCTVEMLEETVFFNGFVNAER